MNAFTDTHAPTELRFASYIRHYLLAVSIAELGIRHAKEQSGLGKTLQILSSLEGLICLKYFRTAIIRGPLRNIPEVHVCNNFINLEKIFLKMLDYF